MTAMGLLARGPITNLVSANADGIEKTHMLYKHAVAFPYVTIQRKKNLR